MIFFGLGAKTINKVDIADTCTNCGNRNTLTLSILMQYGHVFFIPVIPVDIKGVTICSTCKDALKNEQFYESVQTQFQAIKKTYKKPPLWTFSGIILLGLLLVIGIIQAAFGYVNKSNQIDHPQKGDIYEVKYEDSYTLYKLVDVESDSIIYFQVNKYQCDLKKDLKKIKAKGDAAYMLDTLGILRTNLRKLYDEGKIIGIDRQ